MLPFVKQVIFEIDDVRKTFVSVMLILQLGFDFVASLVHGVELVNQIVVVRSGLSQLLVHFVIVNLQSAKFELELICLELINLGFGLKLLDFGFTIAIDFIETNHFALVHL